MVNQLNEFNISIIGFFLEFFSQLISTNRSWDNPPVYLVTMVTMGPVGLMRSTRKQKLFTIIILFLDFFPNSFWPLEVSKKVLVGGGGGGLSKYSVSPGPDFVKVKARFGQVSD